MAPEALAWLARFRLPRQIDEGEATLAASLREAGLLQRSGNCEVERARRFHMVPLHAPLGIPLPSCPVAGERGTSDWLPHGAIDARHLASLADPDVNPGTLLTRASALARLDLGAGGSVVTHPTGYPVHLDAGLARLVDSFATSARVEDVARHLDARVEAVAAACGFLLRRGILWSSADEERERGLHHAGPRDGAPFQVRFPVGGRWRQRFLPYTLEGIGSRRARAAIALVGPCQLQLAAEALEHLAHQSGIRLAVEGFLEPDEAELSRGPWSLVVLSSARYAAQLYEAIAATDLSAIEGAAREVAARVDEGVDLIRARTTAPLLVTSLGPPGLPTVAPWSSTWNEVSSRLAALNARIARSLTARADAWLFDEARIASRVPVGVYWDDEYNALPHHSAASLWSWWVLKPGVTDGSHEREEAAPPPPGPAQGEPAEGLARSILDALERRYHTPLVRSIVMDPDGLLWRGKIAERSEAWEREPNHYADVEEYVFSGIHEALSLLSQRGVRLLSTSRCPLPELRERWNTPSTLRHLVRREDMVDFLAWGDLPALRSALGALGIGEEETLFLGADPPELAGFRGRVWRGGLWQLRRYLLTAPELAHSSAPTPEAPSATSPTSPAGEVSEARIAEALDLALRGAVRSPAEAIARAADLRSLGLDSLRILEVVRRAEQALGVRLAEHELVEPVVFFRAPLLRALRSALRRGNQSPRPLPRERRGDSPFPESSYEAWCRVDLGERLIQNARTSRVPWILKLLRTAEHGDHGYVGWRELLDAAAGHRAALIGAGLEPGDRVGLALPPTPDGQLFAALFGTLLAGAVPVVLPPEGAARGREAPPWFAQMLAVSRPRFCVVGPGGPDAVRSAAAQAGVACEPLLPFAGRARWEGEASPPRAPDDELLIQFSSGTTSARKAVRITQRQLLSQIWQLGRALRCARDDRLVTWLPMHHDMGLVCTLLLPLVLSLPVVVIAPRDWVRHPHLLLEQVSLERATLCWLPNFALQHMARRIPPERLDGLDLGSLRAIINGGEPVTSPAMEAFAERFIPHGLRPSCLTAGYGAAEATAAITQSPPGGSARRVRVEAESFLREGRVRVVSWDRPSDPTLTWVSCGPALERTVVEVVDAQGTPVGEARVGALRLRGDAVCSGYLGAPDASAKHFQDGWLLLGDEGFLLDGEVFVTGRSDDTLVVSGINLQPHVLEEAISALVGVQAGRVVAFDVEDQEASTRALVVMLEPDRDDLGDEERGALSTQVREHILERWSLSARDVVVAPRGTLIKSSSGKLSRKQNRAFFLEGIRR